MLEFPQPVITKSRTAEAGTKSKRARCGKPNRISPSYNRVRLPRRAKAKCYFWVACASGGVTTYVWNKCFPRRLVTSPSLLREKLMPRLLILLGCPSAAQQLRKSWNYFFLGSFFDSPSESLDSFVARLDSPGRYSSCSAAAKAFSNPTISSPGRSVSKDSTSLRNCSSE